MVILNLETIFQGNNKLLDLLEDFAEYCRNTNKSYASGGAKKTKEQIKNEFNVWFNTAMSAASCNHDDSHLSKKKKTNKQTNGIEIKIITFGCVSCLKTLCQSKYFASIYFCFDSLKKSVIKIGRTWALDGLKYNLLVNVCLRYHGRWIDSVWKSRAFGPTPSNRRKSVYQ